MHNNIICVYVIYLFMCLGNPFDFSACGGMPLFWLVLK